MATVRTSIWLVNPVDIGTESAHYVVESGGFEAHGWFKVKDIEVSFLEPTREEVIPSAVSSLRQRAQAIRVEAEEKCTKIEGIIQNLLSITHSTVTVGDDDDIPF